MKVPCTHYMGICDHLVCPVEESKREAALIERDERVKAAVLAAIEDAEFEARMAEEEAKSRRAYARELREACAKEHWWVLKGVVSKETIESLCNVSPSGLLEES